MLRAIFRLVVIDQVVREPFSSRCVARHMPGISVDRVALFLTRHSALSPKVRNPIFIRVCRGRYRFNQRRLSEVDVGQMYEKE